MYFSFNFTWYSNQLDIVHYENSGLGAWQKLFVSDPLNCSKNSILNLVMKLNLFTFFLSLSLFFFFFFFFFEKPLKYFCSIHLFFLLFLCFRYLQKCIKESCVYLSSQLLFKTPHKTLKFKEKSVRKRE